MNDFNVRTSGPSIAERDSDHMRRKISHRTHHMEKKLKELSHQFIPYFEKLCTEHKRNHEKLTIEINALYYLGKRHGLEFQIYKKRGIFTNGYIYHFNIYYDFILSTWKYGQEFPSSPYKDIMEQVFIKKVDLIKVLKPYVKGDVKEISEKEVENTVAHERLKRVSREKIKSHNIRY